MRLPFKQLGDYERTPVVHPDVVDGQDVGMIEHPGRSRLLLEPAQRIGVAGEIARQNFDGDVAAEPDILCSVHLAHPARADGREDLVRTEHRARSKHWARIMSWDDGDCVGR